VTEPLADLGRYSEPALLILISLAAGPKHGYAMMEDIREMTGTRVGPGTLYGALARLERLGLIEPEAAEARRRPYRLTHVGAAVLGTELAKLRRLAETGQQRMGATWAGSM
jgi:DNA-binding PadR family transcriptional regulator